MTDPKAQGYLVDWYAVLGIKSDATPEQVRDAYRAHARDYHPDRYAHLAVDLAAQAAERFRFATEANTVLSNPTWRKEYDAARAAWTGPVSITGHKVIDLSARRFDPSLLFDAAGSDERLARVEEVAKLLASHDEITFSVIKKAAEAEPCDLMIAAAYRQVLRKKDIHLAVRESLFWDTLGDRNRPIDNALPDHSEGITKALEEARRVAKESGAAYALCFASPEAAALTEGELSETRIASEDASGAALSVAYEGALTRFEDIAGRISDIAKERQTVIRERYATIQRRYVEGSPTNGTRVLLRCGFTNTALWMAFALEGTTIMSIDEPLIGNGKSDPLDEDLATAIAQGYSVIDAKLEDDLDGKEQLHAVLLAHFAQHMMDDDDAAKN